MEEDRSPDVRRFSEETLESLASMLRVLADPTRIRLIEALQACDRATVSELTGRVPVGQQGVSHQLLLLHRAGCVTRRREGVRVYYALRDWSGWWLVRELAAEIQSRSDAG
ncbi:MAG: winged helix-turn-helix transcriptional regulator [Actinobacteria bacterium]|nr:winged helix-turn-helix transcriptional regulator [Actinomycetota bacterium]